MAILQGTMQDGTLIPVQADSQGRLVCEGLQGAEGPAGPAGPAGPPGADLSYPPDPYEGAFLMYLNGQPTWGGAEPPIVLPVGTIGSITQIEGTDIFTVESSIDSEIFYVGRDVFASDANGVGISPNPGLDQTQKWSGLLTTGASQNSPITTGQPAEMFNGVGTSGWCIRMSNSNATTTTATQVFDTPIGVSTEPMNLTVYRDGDYGNFGSAVAKVWVNGTLVFSSNALSAQTEVVSIPGAEVPISSIQIGLDFTDTSVYKPDRGFGIAQITMNGKVLVDGPAASGRVSYASDHQIVLSRVAGAWAVGQYITAAPASMARWLAMERGLYIPPSKGK